MTRSEKVQKDIEAQRDVELMVANYVARKLKGVLQPLPVGKHSEKDFAIMVRGQLRTYELKNDLLAPQTRNACFEDSNPDGAPTGIAATKADWWLHKIEHRLYWFPASVMWEHIVDEMKRRTYKYKTNMGDGNADGWLVPIEKLERLEFVKWWDVEEWRVTRPRTETSVADYLSAPIRSW